MVNVLVAGRVETSTAFTGTFLLEDGEQLVNAVRNGDWLSGGLATLSGGLDLAAAVSDPFGTLLAMGYGWLMEHFEPLKGWLNDLTGDAGQVAGFAGTWHNIEARLHSCGQELDRAISQDLYDMSGQAIDAYLTAQVDAAKHLSAAGDWAGAMGTALQVAATIVQVVHDITRDAIAQICGAITSYLLEAVLTLGVALPWIIEQVATRVASMTTRIGRHIDDLITSFAKLRGLLDDLAGNLRGLGEAFDRFVRGAAGPQPALAAAGGPVPHTTGLTRMSVDSAGTGRTSPPTTPDTPARPRSVPDTPAPRTGPAAPPPTPQGSGRSIAEIMSGTPGGRDISESTRPPSADKSAPPLPRSPGEHARFGTSTTTDYRRTFFDAHPGVDPSQTVVHHAVEQQVMRRHPGVVTTEQLHSLENLRGIPKDINGEVHLREIRRRWNEFYNYFESLGRTPSRQELLDYATIIDDEFGSRFTPPERL